MIKRMIARKIYHLLGGLFIPILCLLFGKVIALNIACSLTFISVCIEIARFISVSLNLWLITKFWILIKQQERVKLTGHTYMLIASCIVLHFTPPAIAVLSLLYLAVGDSCASLIGSLWGKHRIFNKTVEGFLGGFIASCIIGLMYIPFFNISIRIAIIGAFTASCVEVLPHNVDDNFSVPILTAAVMYALV